MLCCQGDSNVIGMPLSMLLRNAGVAVLTTCHRISYKEVLMDSRAETRAAAPADADACGPSLPCPDAHANVCAHESCCAVPAYF